MLQVNQMIGELIFKKSTPQTNVRIPFNPFSLGEWYALAVEFISMEFVESTSRDSR